MVVSTLARDSPRIIALVFRDPITKYSLTLFVFTFTFTLAALLRIKQSVPLLTASVAAYGSLFNLGVFIYLIDHLGKSLRPSGALRAVGWVGSKVIDSVYPFEQIAEAHRRVDTGRKVGSVVVTFG